MGNKVKMKVEFKYANDYKMSPIAGVIGNPTPDGLVMCDLYTECAKLPSHSEIEIDTETGVNTEQGFKINAIQRESQFQMVVTPQKARVIAQWLLNAADLAEVVVKSSIDAVSGVVQVSKATK